MTETTYDYAPPVSKLLEFGEHRGAPEWPDYVALGLGPDQIPELIRMALDEALYWADSESSEVWGPIHAWRTLGQLRAEAAVEPLLSLLPRIDEYDDDWVNEELPKVFGYIGPTAVEPLADFLADSEKRLWARVNAASSLAEVGQRHPEAREQCVAALTRPLEQFRTLDPTLNGFIIIYLTDLKAVESAALMEKAFAADRVDLSIQGDWEDVQIQLGLLTERLTPQPDYLAWDPVTNKLQKMAQNRREDHRRNERKAKSKAKAKKKAKRKQQKKTRKKQRKRN